MSHTFFTMALVVAVAGVLTMPARAQEAGKGLSLDEKPQPLAATPFTFPAYTEFDLDNGLHVYVVENHQVPTVTFSLVIRGGEAKDPVGKSGMVSMMADMLGKGTTSRTAQQTSDALDGVGARISANTVGESITVSGAALVKHSDLLFTILAEQLTQATFPEDEFAKLKEQYLASVASQRGNAGELAQALSRKVVYGFSSPLAQRQTEASVNAITREDLTSFYAQHLAPNIASMAVVGDVNPAEVKKMLNKKLAAWKSNPSVPMVQLPDQDVAPAGVYFVPRPGSVQSSIVVGAAIPGVSNPDHLALNVATSYFGSGFGSILFETLRETYSYTYSPFGYVTRGGSYNRLSTGAEVRSSVTDSALNVILTEVSRIAAEGPDPVKLERRIALMAGQYRLAFEEPATVAAILQNAWLSRVPLKDATTYDKRLEQVGFADVQKAVRKYYSPFQLRIAVVGSPEIKSKLEQFGPIYEYTLDLEPATADDYEPVSMSVADVVKAHRSALGGDAVDAVSAAAMTGTATMKMQGRSMNGTVTRKMMVPNKEFASINLGMMRQEQWFNGSQGWVSLNGGAPGEMKPEEVAKAAAETRLFPGLALTENGVKAKVLGKKGNELFVAVTMESGSEQTMVFDATSMLLLRVEKVEPTPQGPITNLEKFMNYTAVNGVQFPLQVVTQNSIYSLTYDLSVQVNTGVTDADFAPAGK